MSALPNDRVPQPANQSWLVARQGQRAKSSPPWNTGMWSPAEIEQLKSNVARYCQHHAIEVCSYELNKPVAFILIATEFTHTSVGQGE